MTQIKLKKYSNKELKDIQFEDKYRELTLKGIPDKEKKNILTSEFNISPRTYYYKRSKFYIGEPSYNYEKKNVFKKAIKIKDPAKRTEYIEKTRKIKEKYKEKEHKTGLYIPKKRREKQKTRVQSDYKSENIKNQNKKIHVIVTVEMKSRYYERIDGIMTTKYFNFTDYYPKEYEHIINGANLQSELERLNKIYVNKINESIKHKNLYNTNAKIVINDFDNDKIYSNTKVKQKKPLDD